MTRDKATAIVDSLCELIDARETHRKYGKVPRGVSRARSKAIAALAKARHKAQGSDPMTIETPHDAFMKADAEFSIACRAYNEASDKLWEATKKRSEAWKALMNRGGEHVTEKEKR